MLVIGALLLLERRLRQIHQRRGIDVDVVEPSGDRLAGELLYPVYFRRRIYRELLGIHLKVVALDEHRTAKSFAQSGRQHHRDVLGGTLISIRDLGARDLEDECSDI